MKWALDEKSINTENIEQLIGKELGKSDWITVDQENIDKYAAATGDQDWLYNDPERAAKESPFEGKTIAQGFYLLSLLGQFAEKWLPNHDQIAYGLNYGLNRVRFIKPVVVGSRIRIRMVMKKFEMKGENLLFTLDSEIEKEGFNQPVVFAEWLALGIIRKTGNSLN